MPTSVRPRRGLVVVAAILAVVLVAGRAFADDGGPVDAARDNLIAALTSPQLRNLDDAIRRAERAVDEAEHAPKDDPTGAQRVTDAKAELKRAQRERQQFLNRAWGQLGDAMQTAAVDRRNQAHVVHKLEGIVELLGKLRDRDGQIDTKLAGEIGTLLDVLKDADPHDPGVKELLTQLDAYTKELEAKLEVRKREARHNWRELVERVNRAIELAKDAGDDGDDEARAAGQRLAGHWADYEDADRNRSKRPGLMERLKIDGQEATRLIRQLENRISRAEWIDGLNTLAAAADRALADGDEDAEDLAARHKALSKADRIVVTRDRVARDGFRDDVRRARELLGSAPAEGTPPQTESPDLPLPDPGADQPGTGGSHQLLQHVQQRQQLERIDGLAEFIQPYRDDDGPVGMQARELFAELDRVTAGFFELGGDEVRAALDKVEAAAVDLVKGATGQAAAATADDRLAAIREIAWRAARTPGDDPASAGVRRRGAELIREVSALTSSQGGNPPTDAELQDLERRAAAVDHDLRAGRKPAPKAQADRRAGLSPEMLRINVLLDQVEPLRGELGPHGERARQLFRQLINFGRNKDRLESDAVQQQLEDYEAAVQAFIEGRRAKEQQRRAEPDGDSSSTSRLQEIRDIAARARGQSDPGLRARGDDLFRQAQELWEGFGRDLTTGGDGEPLDALEKAAAELANDLGDPPGGPGDDDGGGGKDAVEQVPPEEPPPTPDPPATPHPKASLGAAAGAEAEADLGLPPEVTGVASGVGTPAARPSDQPSSADDGGGKVAEQAKVPVLVPGGKPVVYGDEGGGDLVSQGGQAEPIPDAICRQEPWLPGCGKEPEPDVIKPGDDLVPPSMDLPHKDEPVEQGDPDVKMPDLPELTLDPPQPDILPPQTGPDVLFPDLGEGKMFMSSPGSQWGSGSGVEQQGPIDLAPLPLSGGIGLDQGQLSWP